MVNSDRCYMYPMKFVLALSDRTLLVIMLLIFGMQVHSDTFEYDSEIGNIFNSSQNAGKIFYSANLTKDDVVALAEILNGYEWRDKAKCSGKKDLAMVYDVNFSKNEKGTYIIDTSGPGLRNRPRLPTARIFVEKLGRSENYSVIEVWKYTYKEDARRLKREVSISDVYSLVLGPRCKGDPMRGGRL